MSPSIASWTMAAMLLGLVEHVRSQAAKPLATITMRKFTGGFLFFPIWLCGALLGSPSGYLSSAIHFFMLESKLLARLMRTHNLNIVLSLADSSTSTVQSVIGTQPRSTVPQLPIDSATNNTHYRQCEEKQAFQSIDHPPNSSTNKRPVSSKQKTEKPKVQSSTLSKVPGMSEQDKTLANLEKLRQKLLEEKQKHLEALKQQELKRLRNQKKDQGGVLHHTYASFHRDSPKQVIERPRSSSLPSSTRQSDLKQSACEESLSTHVSHRTSGDNHISRTPPFRRPLSLPPGEMYSILELSGENLDLDTQTDNNNETESSSDKENHVVDDVLRGNRNDAVVGSGRSNAMGQINSEQSMYPSLQRKELKHFVPGEDNKVNNLSTFLLQFLS